MQLNAVSVISALLLVAILALSPPFCDGVREEETLKKKSKRPTIGKSPNASPIRKPNALQLAAKKGKQKFHGREALSVQGLSSLAAEPSPPTPKITDKTLTPANAAAKRSALSSLPSLFDRALQPSSLGKKALDQAFQPLNLGASTSYQALQPSYVGEHALDLAFQPSNFGASTSDQSFQPNLGEHALDLALQPSNLGESTANQAFQQLNMRNKIPIQALQPSNFGERTSDLALKLSNLGDMAFPQAFQTLNLEQPAPIDQAFQPWNLRPTTSDVPPLPSSLSDLPQLPSFIPDQRKKQIQQAKMLYLSREQQQLAAKFEKMRSNFLAIYGELPKFSGQPKSLLGMPAHLQQQYKSHPYIAKLLEYPQPAQPTDIFMQNLPKMPSIPQNDQFQKMYSQQPTIHRPQLIFEPQGMPIGHQPTFIPQEIPIECQFQTPENDTSNSLLSECCWT